MTRCPPPLQAWLFDEFSKTAGFSPGIVTGKVWGAVGGGTAVVGTAGDGGCRAGAAAREVRGRRGWKGAWGLQASLQHEAARQRSTADSDSLHCMPLPRFLEMH